MLAWTVLAAAPVVAQAPAPVSAQLPAWDAPRVGLFDRVAQLLRTQWPDAVVRDFTIEPLLREFRAAADSAPRFGDEVALVQRMLQRIPSSHLGLTSVTAAASLTRAVQGITAPMFGMQLLQWEGKWYATEVLNGGPAAVAGVQPWNEVVSIDGVAPGASPRLDLRTDDAFLDDRRDPPVHALRVDSQPTLLVRLRQTLRDTVDVTITAAPYSALEATTRSARVMQLDGGIRVGVVHFWYMHTGRGPGWFLGRFDAEWRDIDAVLVDARGRGGDGAYATFVADVLSEGRYRRFVGPVVVLQDRQTRSAKEVLIDHLRTRKAARLVGEPTAGAVVGSTTRALGHGLMLMMPAPQQDPAFARLELHPIPPDVEVAWPGPLTGRDPIFEAGLAEVQRLIGVQGRGKVLPPPRSEAKLQQLPP